MCYRSMPHVLKAENQRIEAVQRGSSFSRMRSMASRSQSGGSVRGRQPS